MTSELGEAVLLMRVEEKQLGVEGFTNGEAEIIDLHDEAEWLRWVVQTDHRRLSPDVSVARIDQDSFGRGAWCDVQENVAIAARSRLAFASALSSQRLSNGAGGGEGDGGGAKGGNGGGGEVGMRFPQSVQSVPGWQ